MSSSSSNFAINIDESEHLLKAEDTLPVNTKAINLDVSTKSSLLSNWAETVHVEEDKLRYPTTKEEIIDLIKNNDKIRCAGAMHSCAPLIASEGIIMSMTKMDKILGVDVDTKRVRCESGVRIHDLCTELAKYDLAVGTLGTIDWQTISGAVMTGTHGGSLTVPSLHAFVTEYTLITPNCETIVVSKESEPKLFSALAPSMGVFGVVTEMEVQAVPLQILEARMIAVDFDDDFIKSFQDVMESNKYCRVVIYPSIKKVTFWTANPVSSRDDAIARGAVNYPGYCNFRNKAEKVMLEEYLILCDLGEYEEADDVLSQVLESQLERLNHYVGQYNHILCKERNNGIPHADIEFNFDFKKNAEVLTSVMSYCEENRVPYYNFEIRATEQDDAMMSCCQGRDAMWIDFQAKADVATEFFGDIEKTLKPIGFRKHWAKGLDHTDAGYAMKQFPKMHEFIALMQTIDPKGKFRNNTGESWYNAMGNLIEDMNGNEVEDEKKVEEVQ